MRRTALNEYCNQGQELARSLNMLCTPQNLYLLDCSVNISVHQPRGGKKKVPLIRFESARVIIKRRYPLFSPTIVTSTTSSNRIASLRAAKQASKQSSRTSIHTPRFSPRRPHSLPTVQANPYFRVQFHIARKRQPKEAFDSTRASRNPDLVGGNTSKRIGCPAHTPTRQIGQRRAKTSSENIVHQTPKKWQQARNIYGIHPEQTQGAR